MNRLSVAILALSLLILAAGSAAQAAPRSIPWDCSDWQESPAVADADDARVSMILESLAANRGKSIYCAIDQSDTWTKAETWAAGRDRNERDDTVYFGESGNFRGFLAAQEGYLTDGESGVTGVSRDLIFEFPREERRRRWRTIVTESETVEADTRNCYAFTGDGAVQYYNGPSPSDPPCRRAIAPFGEYLSGWQLLGSNTRDTSGHWPPRARAHFGSTADIDWAVLSRAAATAYCEGKGYQRVRNIVATDPPLSGADDWVYERSTVGAPDPNRATHRAAPVNSWSATCQNTKRVRR